jgi:hypothetical protein
MRKTALSVALAGALALPVAAAAQGGYMEIHLELPQILPPMVVIQPGVQVIPEIQHEVFFVGGVYYARHNGGWYRAPRPHGAPWVGVAPNHVPASLVKIPPGHYKNWKAAKKDKSKSKKAFKHGGEGGGNGKKHGKH